MNRISPEQSQFNIFNTILRQERGEFWNGPKWLFKFIPRFFCLRSARFEQAIRADVQDISSKLERNENPFASYAESFAITEDSQNGRTIPVKSFNPKEDPQDFLRIATKAKKVVERLFPRSHINVKDSLEELTKIYSSKLVIPNFEKILVQRSGSSLESVTEKDISRLPLRINKRRVTSRDEFFSLITTNPQRFYNICNQNSLLDVVGLAIIQHNSGKSSILTSLGFNAEQKLMFQGDDLKLSTPGTKESSFDIYSTSKGPILVMTHYTNIVKLEELGPFAHKTSVCFRCIYVDGSLYISVRRTTPRELTSGLAAKPTPLPPEFA